MFPAPQARTDGPHQLARPWCIRPLTDGDEPAVRQGLSPPYGRCSPRCPAPPA